MGCKKGNKHKQYSKEEKLAIILEAMENGNTPTGRKYNLSDGMIANWIKKYHENGNNVVDNKYKRCNPLVKYQQKKNLTREEQLEYENMKLKIENERLKKGYLVKGDGTVVMFKKSK